jgi:hypothetical protein
VIIISPLPLFLFFMGSEGSEGGGLPPLAAMNYKISVTGLAFAAP